MSFGARLFSALSAEFLCVLCGIKLLTAEFAEETEFAEKNHAVSFDSGGRPHTIHAVPT